MQKVPGKMMKETADQKSLELVFETMHTSLLQCDVTNKFIVKLFDQEIELSVCALIAFKKKLQDLDILPLLSADCPDTEIVYLPYCDRLFVFGIHEILELRELLSGGFTMLELNSLIHRQLVRRSF